MKQYAGSQPTQSERRDSALMLCSYTSSLYFVGRATSIVIKRSTLKLLLLLLT
jgi:hypothetical protein